MTSMISLCIMWVAHVQSFSSISIMTSFHRFQHPRQHTSIHPNFSPSFSTTRLSFGIPSWIPNPNEEDEEKPSKKPSKVGDSVEKPKIDLKGIVQLVTAGAGSPFLGDYKGVDKETGNFMFELEANNLTDENGESKQTKAAYFEEGWVDPDAELFRWPWEKKK